LGDRTTKDFRTAEPADGRGPSALQPGVRIEAEHLSRRVKAGAVVLHDISLSIRPGEMVAIVGGSGAGKTTLLEALAGVRPAEVGRVLFDGVDVYRNLDRFRTVLGYVPQDDIIHADLPLERTIRYAAALRLPPETPKSEIDGRVSQALEALDLAHRRAVRVGALSGGQRKRASIAVELLTTPRVFFLDEPTSGLDPATDAELLRLLRSLADGGATVVFTTHAVQDLAACDRIVFLTTGGYLAFDGSLLEALTYFDVTTPERVYERLAGDAGPETLAERYQATLAGGGDAEEPRSEAREGPAPARSAGPLRQWAVLTRRTFETLARNLLTMAILLGSPVLVVAMFAILFRPGAFDITRPSPSAIVMILFWVTFGAFFFGLTYGLLQIVTERAILRREHLVGLRLGAYLMSKMTVLLPFLVIVEVMMLAILRALNRLPSVGFGTQLSVAVTLALDATAALALGLLTSAAVSNSSQATLALPMLCFPAVLFSGAILPVHLMAGVGAAISAVMPVRWAFEAIGHDLGIRALLQHGGSPLGPPLLASYGKAGLHSTGAYWAYLAIFVVVLLAAAWATLGLTLRRNAR
jgi:ABC-type multidrug transport system ATPase subunit